MKRKQKQCKVAQRSQNITFSRAWVGNFSGQTKAEIDCITKTTGSNVSCQHITVTHIHIQAFKHSHIHTYTYLGIYLYCFGLRRQDNKLGAGVHFFSHFCFVFSFRCLLHNIRYAINLIMFLLAPKFDNNCTPKS